MTTISRISPSLFKPLLEYEIDWNKPFPLHLKNSPLDASKRPNQPRSK